MPSVNDKELLAKLRLLDSKQDVLTPGAGIAINQNTDTISGTTITPTIQSGGFKIADIVLDGVSTDLRSPNPQVLEMTKAQYDALSFAQKNNGTAYFIKDEPDIKIWIGTLAEYQALSSATKMKPEILFFIKQEEE